jgi:hypothetical protein
LHTLAYFTGHSLRLKTNHQLDKKNNFLVHSHFAYLFKKIALDKSLALVKTEKLHRIKV